MEAVEAAFGRDVDYAQLVKVYGDIPEGERRYSTPQCKAAVPKVIQGPPNPAHINTSYIERQNLTMRMSNRQLARVTNAGRRSCGSAPPRCFAHYSFCRIHKTLRTGPRRWRLASADTLRDSEWTLPGS